MRWLLAFGAVVLAVLLWLLHGEVASSARADEPTAAVREADDPDDVEDTDEPAAAVAGSAAPAGSKRARRQARAVATVKPFDPWADPPPLDPRVPHLEVTEDEPHAAETSPRGIMHERFMSQMTTVRPAIQACAELHHVTESFDVVVVATISQQDGKTTVEPMLQTETLHQSRMTLDPGFEHCVEQVVSSLDLAIPDDDHRTYHTGQLVHVN